MAPTSKIGEVPCVVVTAESNRDLLEKHMHAFDNVAVVSWSDIAVLSDRCECLDVILYDEDNLLFDIPADANVHLLIRFKKV